MKQVSPSTKLRCLKSRSRILARGVLGNAIHGNSQEGRFLRDVVNDLISQLGRAPTFGEHLLVRRIARASLQLELCDQKFATSGSFSANDARAFSALSNQMRLGLRDLGLKPKAGKAPPTVADVAARHKVAAE